MQSRPWIAVVLVVSAGLAAQTAAADPQEDVAAAGQKWGTVFADNNPDTMMPLYAKDGVLWGTLSPTVRSDPAAVKAYFVAAFQALPKATVKFGDQLIRVYGNTAVNTGYYTFSYTKDGETKSIPARYSFTYVKDGNDWKIVDHHSSAMPAPAPAPAPRLQQRRRRHQHDERARLTSSGRNAACAALFCPCGFARAAPVDMSGGGRPAVPRFPQGERAYRVRGNLRIREPPRKETA